MTEKGGKVFSSQNGSNSNEDDFGKKRERKKKVEDAKIGDTLKSRDKADISFGKVDNGKTQISSKSKQAGKGVAPTQPPSPSELEDENELPENARCVMDCEAFSILQGIQEQMVVLSEDPSINLSLSFDRCLLYSKTNNHYTDSYAVRSTLDTLKKVGLSDIQICMVANICPENSEQVFAAIPSLRDRTIRVHEAVKDVVDKLKKLKHANRTP